MIPAAAPAAAAKTVEVVRVVRAFPWLRVLAVILLAAFLLWRYFIHPAIDSLTPWEGIRPNPSMPNIPGTPWPLIPDPPWDGIIPGSCTVPAPAEPPPFGFDAMAHDLGLLVNRLSRGPAPSREEYVSWFTGAGEELAETAMLVRSGVEGKPYPIPLAPLPGEPGAQQVSCGPTPGSVPGAPDVTWTSGFMPDSALVPVQSGKLRADAAAAFTLMAEAFRAELGKPLTLTSGYRSYEQQVQLHKAKPRLAAPAGKSNHGLGVAVDIGSGVQSFRTTEHRWMQLNAGRFGYVHPSWAQQGGSKPEPWHWEYVGMGTEAG